MMSLEDFGTRYPRLDVERRCFAERLELRPLKRDVYMCFLANLVRECSICLLTIGTLLKR